MLQQHWRWKYPSNRKIEAKRYTVSGKPPRTWNNLWSFSQIRRLQINTLISTEVALGIEQRQTCENGINKESKVYETRDHKHSLTSREVCYLLAEKSSGCREGVHYRRWRFQWALCICKSGPSSSTFPFPTCFWLSKHREEGVILQKWRGLESGVAPAILEK